MSYYNLHGLLSAGSVAAAEALGSPLPAYAAAYSTTKIFVWWQKVSNPDSYKVERDTSNTFSIPTVIQNTSANEVLDTGLTIDTIYYYRITAIGSGFEDSTPVVVSRKTLGAAVDMFLLPMGLEREERAGIDNENDYGEVRATGGWSNKYKSIGDGYIDLIRPAGTSETPAISKSYDSASTETAKYIGGASSDIMRPSEDMVFDGAFSVLIELERMIEPINRILFNDSTSDYLFLSNLNSVRLDTAGAANQQNYPDAPLPLNTRTRVAIERDDSDVFRISNDEGENWSAGVTISGTLTISTTTGSVLSGALLLWNTFIVKLGGVLTTSQIQEYFNYTEQTNVAPVANGDTLKGITIDQTLSSNELAVALGELSVVGTGNVRHTRHWIVGSKIIIYTHGAAESPYFSQDGIYVYDFITEKISLKKPFPVYEETGDVHLNGGMSVFDDRLIQVEANNHYDTFEDEAYLQITSSGRDLDLGEFTTQKFYNGHTKRIGYRAQYGQHHKLGDDYYLIFQEYDDISPSGAHRLCAYRSKDLLNTFEKKTIINNTNEGHWAYPASAYDPTSGAIYLVNNVFDTIPTELDRSYNKLHIIKYEADGTASNLLGTPFSKNVGFDQVFGTELNTSDLDTNFLIFDASGTTKGTLRITDIHLDGEILYFICGDGTAPDGNNVQGWRYCEINLTTRVLTYNDIDTGAVELVAPNYHEGNVIRRISATDIRFYALTYNSGDNQIVEFRSADKFATTVSIHTTHASASGKKYFHLRGAINAVGQDYFAIFATKSATATLFSNSAEALWVKDVT